MVVDWTGVKAPPQVRDALREKTGFPNSQFENALLSKETYGLFFIFSQDLFGLTLKGKAAKKKFF